MESELETLKARRIHLYEDYAIGNLSKESYVSEKAEITEKMELVQEKITAVKEAVETEDALVTGVKRIANDSEDVIEKRLFTPEIANAYIEQVTIYDPKHMEIKFTFEDLLQKAAERVEVLQEGEVAQ